MIALDEINKACSLGIETSVLSADSEISLYGIGAFEKGGIIRVKLNYLELYTNCLKDIITFTTLGMGTYEDLGFTKQQLQQCIDSIYEICTTVFRVNPVFENTYFYLYPTMLSVENTTGYDTDVLSISTNKSWETV